MHLSFLPLAEMDSIQSGWQRRPVSIRIPIYVRHVKGHPEAGLFYFTQLCSGVLSKLCLSVGRSGSTLFKIQHRNLVIYPESGTSQVTGSQVTHRVANPPNQGNIPSHNSLCVYQRVLFSSRVKVQNRMKMITCALGDAHHIRPGPSCVIRRPRFHSDPHTSTVRCSHGTGEACRSRSHRRGGRTDLHVHIKVLLKITLAA